ncbi:hypothetical protein [Paracoccus thiocyanatus]|uniref:hypothetical protein n=1 Tax=Paracoccus thiocyanatus TaxID=34006 RepID=UPI00122D2EF3|nr:hypothetical protein [Paracoccus thiocyanatus]
MVAIAVGIVADIFAFVADRAVAVLVGGRQFDPVLSQRVGDGTQAFSAQDAGGVFGTGAIFPGIHVRHLPKEDHGGAVHLDGITIFT